MEYFIALIGLLGVAIGGFLTPWVTSRMETARIKKSIRPELIENIYTFFNLRKGHISESNLHDYKVKISGFATTEQVKLAIPADPKKENALKKLIELNDPSIAKTKSDYYFEQLIGVESKIISLICQTQQYYGEDVYKKLYKLIKPEIDKSNEKSTLHDYMNLSPEQLQNLSRTLDNEVYEAMKKLDPICDSIITKVMSTVK